MKVRRAIATATVPLAALTGSCAAADICGQIGSCAAVVSVQHVADELTGTTSGWTLRSTVQPAAPVVRVPSELSTSSSFD